MIHILHPTLCFIGIPIQICPFPQFDLQAQLFVKSLTGEFQLPSQKTMFQDTFEEKQAKTDAGVAARHFHKMGASQWEYNRSLCSLAHLNEIPNSVEKLYTDLWSHRPYHLTTYKKDSYMLEGPNSYRKL